MLHCTITVVGDGVVGKTCLLYRYVNKISPEDVEYVPTVFDNYTETVHCKGDNVCVELWDTAGQEEYERLRILAYCKTDIFLLCYNVNDNVTLNNCKTLWIPELRRVKKCPVILVGTQTDSAKNLEEVQRSGKKAAKEMKMAGFFLTSSYSGDGVREVVYEAVRIYINHTKKKCTVL